MELYGPPCMHHVDSLFEIILIVHCKNAITHSDESL